MITLSCSLLKTVHFHWTEEESLGEIRRFDNSTFCLHKQIKLVTSVPIPSRIRYQWNYGSLLGYILLIQLVRGFFLALQYERSSLLSFKRVVSFINRVDGGWLIRFVHANGASFFFILLYLHIGRGIYYGSYKNWKVWTSGVMIIFVLMATAFLGYVLPWGQMSFWGATVITNLLSAVPYIGEEIVYWLWGGFRVRGPTLTRMFSFHYLLPFVLRGFVMLHLIVLHEKGSSNPLGISSNSYKVRFHSYFSVKDVLGIVILTLLIGVVILHCPDLFMDPDNSIEANPIVTPPHIQPEWYFLFAYSVLRVVPRKLGGVIALVARIAVLLILPLTPYSSGRFRVKHRIFTWFQVNNFSLLTWLGRVPVEPPFERVRTLVAYLYFTLFLSWGYWERKVE